MRRFRPLDGFGDNSDPWPNDPSEWMDSDFDGVGDNEDFGSLRFFRKPRILMVMALGIILDLWPYDASKKRDSDGDGIADSVDAFPNNANLDSWTGIIVSLVIISVIVIVGIILFRKSKKSDVKR